MTWTSREVKDLEETPKWKVNGCKESPAEHSSMAQGVADSAAHLLSKLGQHALNIGDGARPFGGLHGSVGVLEHVLQAPEGRIEGCVHGLSVAVYRPLEAPQETSNPEFIH